MDSDFVFYFLIFISINTIMCYRAGHKNGRYEGITQTIHFLKSKRAFKDKKDILGYSTWPEAVRSVFEEPDKYI